MLLINIYIIQFLLLYILSPFLRFIEFTNIPLSSSKYLLIALFLLSFVFIIINIVTAFTGLKQTDSNIKNNILGFIMRLKLVFIPFFITHAFYFLVIMGGTANPFLYILWFILPFLFLFYAYLILLTTSSYLIVQIIKMGKSGMLTKGQCVLHIIMQLLFFADVIDSVYLFVKYRKRI